MPRTKQLRLSNPAQIRKAAGNFIGKKINIVLADDRVVFGTLEAVTDAGITVSNMRLARSSYNFDQLSEVYVDSIV